MTKVAFTDSDSLDPTKAFADAAWRGNPRISPSSFRVAQGLTVSKVVFDGRGSLEGWREAVAAGCNVLLVGDGTVEALDFKPEGTVVVWEALKVFDKVPDGVDMVLVRGDRADWDVLEGAVKAGEVLFYGVVSDGMEDVGPWMAAAEAAAARVWGRRKRSGLKALMVPFNLAEQQAVRVSATRHGEERVPVVELAARLGWWVLADRPCVWQGPWGALDVAAGADEASVRGRMLLESRMPAGWQGVPATMQAWAVASSMAGVGSVVADGQHCPFFEQFMDMPDLVDIRAVLEGA